MNKINTVCQIDNHSLLIVQGPDAKKFLQGQVTCDIEQLSIQPNDQGSLFISSLGAHCTHKGRMVFSFRALALDEQTIALKIPNNTMDIATNALKKYIVFSKAELINASEQYKLIGIHSDTAIEQLTDIFPRLPDEVDTAINNEHGIIIRLPNNRYELWITEEQYMNITKLLSDQFIENHEYWDFANITDGFGEIQAETSELLTPHAINLQSTSNGVSFNKGCYTGQEVVARMHYLGKLKRQMFLFNLPTESDDNLPNIGDQLYSTNKSQSIGDIVLIAKYQGQIRLLASVTVEQAKQDLVFIDQDCKKPLHLLPLNEES